MDQTLLPDESRERAVSSEPCSTRLNPFGESDTSSRKRRRTSLSGDSRSKSADSLVSSPSPSSPCPALAETSPAAMTLASPEPDAAAMKLDTDPPVSPRLSLGQPAFATVSSSSSPSFSSPTTFAIAAVNSEPSQQPTPSRVTINIRNSRPPLETIASSSSPIPVAAPSLATMLGDGVKTKLQHHADHDEDDRDREEHDNDDDVNDDDHSDEHDDEPDIDVAQAPPISVANSIPSTDSGSPPIEVIVEPDNESNYDDPSDPDVTIIEGIHGNALSDPTPEFPFYEMPEALHDTVSRLTQYLPTHEAVSRSLADWAERCLIYFQNVSHRLVCDSITEFRDLWLSLPELIYHMEQRRPPPLPRNNPGMRSDLLRFYAAFAKLTAFFVEFDLKNARNAEHSRPFLILISPTYLHALALLIRHDETIRINSEHLLTNNTDVDWSGAEDMIAVLQTFLAYNQMPGGVFPRLLRLAHTQLDQAARFPKAVENLALLSYMVANVVRDNHRRLRSPHTPVNLDHLPRSHIHQGYQFYLESARMLEIVIEKHTSHLSPDSATSQICALTEIYQVALATDGAVNPELLKIHRRKYPALAPQHVPEAIAYRWRFTMLTKLIKSGQMPLRVSAVSTMSADLLTFWKRYNEPADAAAAAAFLAHIADFLISSGLIGYILGPTCHPEITIDTGSIIGFLIVSHAYTPRHTDQLWQTVTSTRDPRVSDALVRMASHTMHLMEPDGLIYFCEKLNTLPVEHFTPTVRDLCDEIFRQLPKPAAAYDRQYMCITPYKLCIRLIRESSTPDLHSSIALPEVHAFAVTKFEELLPHGPNEDGRREIYLSCLRDLEDKSPYTLGSLWVILHMIRPYVVREMQVLSRHNFTALMIDELAVAIAAVARLPEPRPVLHGSHNQPRKELIKDILLHQPSTVTDELGVRLWDMLVGSAATCQQDRDVAWYILNNSLRRHHQAPNPFVATCFENHLPSLPPDCFCPGALDFLRDYVLPLVNDPASLLLDVDDADSAAAGEGDASSAPAPAPASDATARVGHKGLEQLWRMVLTAPERTIEPQAIRTLVSDVYMESRSIMSLPHFKARKVHLALVNRCLRQLSSAAAMLKGPTTPNPGEDANGQRQSHSDGDNHDSNDNHYPDVMALDANPQQRHEQELLLTRSLALLSEFHRLYQAKAHFSAPDLSFMMLESSEEMRGDPAELKYQAFDGDKQTEIQSLDVGVWNSVASLLASLRDATGFPNFRIYYRGRLFMPQQADVDRTLEDVNLQCGMMLVKREPQVALPPTRARPGASPVDIEILGHFDELWEYLSLDENLARPIFEFLKKLPPDENLLRAFEESTSYKRIFPLGQPLKSLYAQHALTVYLRSLRDKRTIAMSSSAHSEAASQASAAYYSALAKALLLVVAAISDDEVINHHSTPQLRLELATTLVDSLLVILGEKLLSPLALEALDAALVERLLTILSSIASEKTIPVEPTAIQICLLSILECCLKSQVFWETFRSHPLVPSILRDLILNDTRLKVRQKTADAIRRIIWLSQSASPDSHYREFPAFFWPVISSFIAPALHAPHLSREAMCLALEMFRWLYARKSPIINVQQLLCDWGNLLVTYNTFEDATTPDVADQVVEVLILLMDAGLHENEAPVSPEVIPSSGLARRLFWKHLFPSFGSADEKPRICPIISTPSRRKLMRIIFALIGSDPLQQTWILNDLNGLVPYYPNDDRADVYAYDLPQQFDRTKALRSTCGYAGLRNLSNTCYLNSLFTQLFMNFPFRQFMLNAEVQDEESAQALLFQTQKMFAYLQSSLRRFYDPEDCVFSIKTYDDTQIDIHNQMDVDEFFNLLFDRWESQFLTAESKRHFRSFYGGQLVQQVASKECDHISERLEPFSAIQCDIKGKTTLQESLQAYVDGEIMDGENRYKCSTCDRHVDAVKRACLKDIPDNLIFHLKRFDFNLRTLQRSKINDYFAFPAKIDMRPYKIEHLSNPSDELPEDIFELVGVLVHSGTAESGHYYSYIRERPTQRPSETWIEFNDDVVSTWDPALMESSCFGGPEYRAPFDGTGVLYDKTYSAYMLFYQRSSSLAQSQASVAPRPMAIFPGPVQAMPPAQLDQHISSENIALVRRHCLFDPTHIGFVIAALAKLCVPKDARPGPDYTTVKLGMDMALGHLDQVASRAKDCPDWEELFHTVSTMCASYAQYSLAAFEYFSKRHEACRALIQRNSEASTREEVAALVINAVAVVKSQLPERYGLLTHDPDDETSPSYDCVLPGMLRIFQTFWDHFPGFIRAWNEVFKFMLDFVRLGHTELAAYLGQPFLCNLIYVVMADSNLELPSNFAKMVSQISRRVNSRPPSYQNILSLLERLITSIQITVNGQGEPIVLELPAQRCQQADPDLDAPFSFTRLESKLIHQDWAREQSNIFIEKLIGLDQNPAAVDSIVAHLLRQSPPMDEKIFRTLRNAISSQITSHQSAPYLRVASAVYCRYSSSLELIHALIRHVNQQCLSVQSVEGKAFFDFQREVFDGPRECSGETAEEVIQFGYENLAHWVPGLLAYFETTVPSEVEAFLHEKLFNNESPARMDGGTPAPSRLAQVMHEGARKLGIRCLCFLRDSYVSRRNSIVTQLVSGIERVIGECTRYYDLGEGSQDAMGTEFVRLSQSVLEPLHRLSYEEREEEGSGMCIIISDSSSISSSVTAG